MSSSLFPPDIATGEFPHLDSNYVSAGRIYKNTIDNLWQKFEPYADNHFRNEIKNHFYQRVWEMYMGNVLLENGLEIKSKNEGPDFIIPGTAYVECVAPTKGADSNADAVPEMPYSNNPRNSRLTSISFPKITLRITQSIESKANVQYKNWEGKDWFDSTMPFIIAINTADILEVNADIDDILIMQSLFGIHGTGFDLKTGDARFLIQNNITRANGSEVPVGLFNSQDYKQISGVLFSHNPVVNHLDNIGSDCTFVNNPFAANHVSKDFAKHFDR